MLHLGIVSTFRTVTMFVLTDFGTIFHMTEVTGFSNTHYRTSFHDPKVGGVRVSYLRSSRFSHITIRKSESTADGLQWHKVHTKFRENESTG
jgi:hypothetical protein